MSLIGKTVEEQMWNFFMPKIGNAYGVCALMGNWQDESGFNPKNMQNSYEKGLGLTDESYTEAVDTGRYGNFVHDGVGYGSAQWTFWSRKQGLLDLAKKKGRSIGDTETQFEFCYQELCTGYKSVLAVMKSAKSVKEASDVLLTQYERPADQSEAVKKKRAGYGEAFYEKYAAKSATLTPAGGKAVIKTNTDLAAMLKKIATGYKTLYVMGCFGAPMTEANKTRYCSNHSYNQQAARTAMIKAATVDTFGFDCVCLIKGVLWGWNGDAGKVYGGAAYASNGVPDIAPDAMIAKCKDISTDFSRIEVGEVVWLPGHIGVYIGEGLAVECTPDFRNCVQITAVQNIGIKSGFNARKWTKHGKLPYITYEKITGSTSGVPPQRAELEAAQTPQAAGTGFYRVRKSWDKPGTQIGAFKVLDNAVKLCRQNSGYKVYDPAGKEVQF